MRSKPLVHSNLFPPFLASIKYFGPKEVQELMLLPLLAKIEPSIFILEMNF